MVRLHKLLDPMQTGQEAGKLDSNLRKRIVGQDDAIQQIVDVYQTHLAEMSSPGMRQRESGRRASTANVIRQVRAGRCRTEPHCGECSD